MKGRVILIQMLIITPLSDSSLYEALQSIPRYSRVYKHITVQRELLSRPLNGI